MAARQIIPEILENIPSLVVMYNIKTGEYLFVNEAVRKVLGYEPDDFIKGGLGFATNIVHPEDLPRILEENSKALEMANAQSAEETSTEPIVSFEYRMQHKDGSWRWFFTEGTVFKRDDEGKVELILNTSIDITDRKEREREVLGLSQELEELRDSETSFRNFIEAVEDYAIFRLDKNGRILSWNQGIFNIFGYSEEEIIGQPISIFFTPEDLEVYKVEEELKKAQEHGTTYEEGIRIRKDGTAFFASSTVTAIKDAEGVLQGYTKIVRDVTERKEAEETIRFQATHDSLTGLANRKALEDHFVMALSMAMRNQYKLAVLFLDLDRFKNINDTLGHSAGDLVLKEVALRLQNCVRKEDTVARLGGDEFIILLNEVRNIQDTIKVAEKIMESFKTPVRLQNQNLHVTTSIGIAMFPSDGQDLHALLKNSDTSLYRAKDAGRNRFQFYNYSMNLQSEARLALEQDLRTAIQEQMYLVYQPFVDLKDNAVVGVEALLRWKHPKLGTLLPFDFIPLAEEVGMIVPISEWVLNRVCEEGKKFAERGLVVSFNVSAQQFSEANFVSQVQENLEKNDFKAELLEMEVTESMAMENINRTAIKLHDIAKLGVSIAIDDFGTGYSSLSYLSRFPVHKLKIDKSFVKRAIVDSQDTAIIRAVIAMGHGLNLKVCAEGVEQKQQKTLLKSMGCDIIQGYLISKPLPSADIVELLDSQKI